VNECILNSLLDATRNQFPFHRLTFPKKTVVTITLRKTFILAESRWPSSTIRSASRHQLTVPPRYRLNTSLFSRRSYFVELFTGSSSWFNT